MQKFKTESSGAAKKEDLSKVRRGCYVVEKYELFLASIGMGEETRTARGDLLKVMIFWLYVASCPL